MWDIKNFYLNTPLNRKECIKLKLADIPEEAINEYKLKDLSTKDDSVYLEVNKGVYGLPQVGLLAQELLSMDTTRAKSPQDCGSMSQDS